MVATYLVCLTLAGNPAPLHARVEALREQVRQNRALEDEDRALLEAKLAGVDSALAKFERLVSQGEDRRRQMAPVLVAGTALVADDATGVGAADDPLLLIVALAAASIQARTHAPASDLELQAAQSQLEAAIEAAVQAGQAVLMTQQATSKIQGLSAHLAQTLARILGRSVGGKPPDHQQDPNRDRRHWWVEARAAFQQIQRFRLTPKQWAQRLKGAFTDTEQVDLREALNEVAKLMGEEPPNWPPPVAP